MENDRKKIAFDQVYKSSEFYSCYRSTCYVSFYSNSIEQFESNESKQWQGMFEKTEDHSRVRNSPSSHSYWHDVCRDFTIPLASRIVQWNISYFYFLPSYTPLAINISKISWIKDLRSCMGSRKMEAVKFCRTALLFFYGIELTIEHRENCRRVKLKQTVRNFSTMLVLLRENRLIISR